MIGNILILVSVALSPVELYSESNRSYETGEFAQAIEGYEEALRSVANANVYYNLANSYFQVKKIGEAIASYRRARFLRPRDEDVGHNLAFARNYRVDKIGDVSSPFAEFLSRAFHHFSLYETSLLATFFFLVSSLLISLFVVYRNRPFVYGLIISALMCTYFFVTWQVWRNEVRSVPAVVVVPEAVALSGPGDDYKEILTLHDGTELTVKEARGEYVLIQIPGGIGGWVKEEVLTLVFPKRG